MSDYCDLLSDLPESSRLFIFIFLPKPRIPGIVTLRIVHFSYYKKVMRIYKIVIEIR